MRKECGGDLSELRDFTMRQPHRCGWERWDARHTEKPHRGVLCVHWASERHSRLPLGPTIPLPRQLGRGRAVKKRKKKEREWEREKEKRLREFCGLWCTAVVEHACVPPSASLSNLHLSFSPSPSLSLSTQKKNRISIHGTSGSRAALFPMLWWHSSSQRLTHRSPKKLQCSKKQC